MEKLRIKDKTFDLFVTADEIAAIVKRVADAINCDLQGKNPLFLPVLNGAFMFASDLMKQVDILSELAFVKFSSYEGTVSTGELHQLIGLEQSVAGRVVVVIEDIVDTGLTMRKIVDLLNAKGAAEVKVATFCSKPSARKIDVDLDYVGFEIDNRFVVGYGLDYDGYGRNRGELYVWNGTATTE